MEIRDLMEIRVPRHWDSFKVSTSPSLDGDGDVNTSGEGSLSNNSCAFSDLILATAITLSPF